MSDTRVQPGGHHELEEHTGELRVRREAPTLDALFAEAARALAEVMGAVPAREGDDALEERVVLDGVARIVAQLRPVGVVKG